MQTKKKQMEITEEIVISTIPPLPLLSLNHISLLCRSIRTSVRFYEEILGFFLIKRPSSFDFDGAWLFNYGVGIHLLENSLIDESDELKVSRPINSKDNHVSFQCTDIWLVKTRLEQMGIEYMTAIVEDGGGRIDQVFFHDPDGYMIEICNCENLPVLPVSSSWLKRNIACNRAAAAEARRGMMESMMMDSLSMDMINLSF